MAYNQGLMSLSLEKRKEIARKGGLAVSRNREYMATIGRKGGIRSGEVRSTKTIKPNETTELQ